MLLELKVSHFAVIDSLQVHFLRPGLNVLTGETGAGKSILLKSLALLMGGKASPDMVRAGHEQAVIEGAFDLSYRPDLRNELKEAALDSGDDCMVVRRIISAAGKHRLYINGSLSTLNVLERLLPRLIEITGQHEHHSLTKPMSQLNLLDDYAALNALRAEYASQFALAKKLREDIESLSLAARDREQRLDFLKFQIEEIDAFNPSPGEDAELSTRYQRARFASRLNAFAQKAENALYSGDHSLHSVTGDLLQEGESLIQLDPKLKPGLQALREAAILIEDASFSFRDYAKTGGSDEGEMERLEERVSTLRKLQKKYGATVEEILEFRNKSRAEVEALEKHDENVKALQIQLKDTEARLEKLAGDLHAKRVKSAKKLSEGINSEIDELNMKGVSFSIAVDRTGALNSTGGDEVQFLIKTSPKDDFKPIAKIASGGELSRLMLAIKQVVAATDQHMTFLFDEVDAGVSGPTAEKVGRKLKTLGSFHQVICITHLPQVAAFADAHFLITKEVAKGQVKSEVTELGQKERIRELGRMISGEKITDASLNHAKQMIEQSQAKKPARKPQRPSPTA